MREIVGRMRLEEMVSDRQKFANLVKENAEPDLAAMGLDIVSFNVQNFSDGNGVIEDLGIDNISQIKKKAAIAKAEADVYKRQDLGHARRIGGNGNIIVWTCLLKRQDTGHDLGCAGHGQHLRSIFLQQNTPVVRIHKDGGQGV